MGWRDLPWGYIAKFVLFSAWIALPIYSLVTGSVTAILIAMIIVALAVAHIVASTSRDYHDFICKVQEWRENGGGR